MALIAGFPLHGFRANSLHFGGREKIAVKYALIAIVVITLFVALNVAIDGWLEDKWNVLAKALVGAAAILGASFWVRKVAGMPVDGIVKATPLFAASFIAVALVYLLLF